MKDAQKNVQLIDSAWKRVLTLIDIEASKTEGSTKDEMVALYLAIEDQLEGSED